MVHIINIQSVYSMYSPSEGEFMQQRRTSLSVLVYVRCVHGNAVGSLQGRLLVDTVSLHFTAFSIPRVLAVPFATNGAGVVFEPFLNRRTGNALAALSVTHHIGTGPCIALLMCADAGL